MANEIASNISQDDRSIIDNMDMEKMISQVTKNVFKMMGTGGVNMAGNSEDGMPNFDLSSLMESLGNMGNNNNFMGNDNIDEKSIETLSEPDDEIYLKTRDICFDLNVDLEDFYNGKKKKLNVKRKRIIEVDGKQQVIEEKKKLIIPIERGMKDEQQIRFEGEADQIPGYKPGDIIITLIENEHPFFQRDSDNLIIVKNINLYDNYDLTFDIKHLDSRILRITKLDSDALHLNDSLRIIKGEGMPQYKSSTEKGDLFIRFNLVIPKSIEPKILLKLKELFDNSENKLSDKFDVQRFLENVSESDLESESSDEESESSDEESELESESSDDDSVSSVSTDSSVEFSSKKNLKR